MPRPALAYVDATLFGSVTSIELARALFDVDVDRQKRIDDTIDYFGSADIAIARDPCGESLLDGPGAR